MNNLTLAVQAIKDTISAQDVGRMMGLEIRHGRCQCPLHGGKDFNCVLYKGNRGFYCHVCKRGGDVIKFAQEYYQLSFKDSVAWFNDAFHMGLELSGNISPDKRRQAEMALKMRKNAIEFQTWKDRALFDLALDAEDYVRWLEDQRDKYRPTTYGEEWDERFCAAVLMIPEARQLAEDCIMNCMKEKTE